MPLNETAIQFDTDGQRIHGMLHLPLNPADKVPAVLMLHGFTGQRMEPHRLFVLFSRLLARHGIASLRFDFRGSGESEGGFEEMTVSREIEDVMAAHRFLLSRPEVDPSRVGLLGLSMGGMVAALSVARLEVAALCLWAPAHPKLWLGEFSEEQRKVLPQLFAQAEREGKLPPGVRTLPDGSGTDWNGNPVGWGFFADLERHEPFDSVRSHRNPALVVHGTADPTVPFAIGEAYARSMGAPLRPIEGGLHTFEVVPHQAEVHQVTLEFFKQHLG
ncbi:MAG: alpha/beta fold hydrolase [Meiothermus sp.]|nr:alpha/beta fold hydrolase [Meiothermus sp.]